MERRRQRGAARGEKRRGLALLRAKFAADPAGHGVDLVGLAGRVQSAGAMCGGDGDEVESDGYARAS
jgi:hypothetical protein